MTCTESSTHYTSCVDGYYLATSSNTCKQCSQNCAICTVPSDIQWTTCADGYYRNSYSDTVCTKCRETLKHAME